MEARERLVRGAIAVIGVLHVAIGGLALLAPQTFFDEIGNYPPANLHYVGDAGAFIAAYGIALLLAARRTSWWTPLLLLGAVWYALHALNHAFDIGEAASEARGVFDTFWIGVSAAALAWLAHVASRLRTGPGPGPTGGRPPKPPPP